MTSMMGSTEDLDAAFAEMDPNGDGSVDFEEFLAWFRRTHPETKEDVDAQVRFLFDIMDEDMDGELDKVEVGKVMKRLHLKTGGGLFRPHKTLDTAFAAMGPNDRGAVTFEKFLNWYHTLTGLQNEVLNHDAQASGTPVEPVPGGTTSSPESKAKANDTGRRKMARTDFTRSLFATAHAISLTALGGEVFFNEEHPIAAMAVSSKHPLFRRKHPWGARC